jgi:1-acyl-sn-glycerol-3-phosphate acyltransferase
MLNLISKFYFWLIGWKAIGKKPEFKKFILVAAPHTSNWDFPITIAACSLLGVKINFLAKKSLFKFPLGSLMKALGGIPVERTKSTNMTERMVELFNNRDELALIVAVEGTRGLVSEWKSGFYYMAVEAKVPIVLGFLDYGRKRGGFFDDIFHPSGNFEEDLPKIKAYFKGITPKHPEKSSLKDYFKNTENTNETTQ